MLKNPPFMYFCEFYYCNSRSIIDKKAGGYKNERF